MPETKDLFQILTNAQNILILLNKELSFSDIQSLVPLVSAIKSYDKKYQILSIKELSNEMLEFAKSQSLNVINKLKSNEYIVTIDYGNNGIEKIVYDIDKEKGSLVFKIIPTQSGFNFNNVKFSEGGDKFDATISINISNPSELGEFYDVNEYLFRENMHIKYSKLEEINSFLIDNSSDLKPEVIDNLTQGFVNNNNVLEGSLSTESQNTLAKLLEQRVDLSKHLQKKYYNKSESHLSIIKDSIENMVKNNHIVYSIVKTDFSYSDLQSFGRIPFNIVSGVKLAFLFLEVKEGLALIVESNEEPYSANTIAGVYEGTGDVSHATCLLKDITIGDLSKRFWPIIKDLYNIDITIDVDNSNVDNLGQVLTKPRRNSKNKGSKNNK